MDVSVRPCGNAALQLCDTVGIQLQRVVPLMRSSTQHKRELPAYRTPPLMKLRRLFCVFFALLPLTGMAKERYAQAPVADQGAAQKQTASSLPLETIAAVRVDRNGDHMPDRKGARVHVRGVATVPSPLLRDGDFQIMVQDASGGIGLYHRATELAVRQGDLVDAVGEVGQYKGAVQLRDAEATVVGHADLPQAPTISLANAAGWKYMGRRVRVRGRIADIAVDDYGVITIRGDTGQQFSLFVASPLTSKIDWKQMQQGAEVVATGVVSIHKASMPYDSGFQLILTQAADLRAVSPPVAHMPRWVLWAVAATVGLVSLVLFAFYLAQRRQRERDAEMKTLAALTSSFATSGTGEPQLARHACDVLTAYGVVDVAMVQLFDHRGSLQQVAVSTVDPKLGKSLEGTGTFCISGHSFEEQGRQIQERVADTGLKLLAVHPLLTSSGSLGFLIALSPRNAQPTAAQERTLTASVKLLAMALENARNQERARVENRELQQLVISDELTGLYNRRFLDEYLRVQVPLAVRRGGGLAFLACDIDHFKRINDAHGHHAGDSVLAGIGVELRQASRSCDLAVRVGGEEFLLVIAEDTSEGAASFAERLRETVAAQSFDTGNDGGSLQVTVSIGVSIFGVHGDSADVLLRAADEAMYASKRGGRNRVTVAPAPADFTMV